jgi:hypothetical protein
MTWVLAAKAIGGHGGLLRNKVSPSESAFESSAAVNFMELLGQRAMGYSTVTDFARFRG